MASYKEFQPTHFNQYIPDVSVEDFKNVLGTMQQQYDTNYDKLQSLRTEILGLSAIRDIDKEYLKKRQNEVFSNMNKYNMDLRDNRNVNHIMSSAIPLYQDNKILNMQESAIKMQKFVKNVDEFKLKNPDKYSAENEAWDKQEMERYLNSSDINDRYNGPTGPTPFRDVDKTSLEMIKNIPKTTQKLLNGYIIEGRSAESIKQVLQAGLTNDDWKQLHINAWANGALSSKSAEKLKSKYQLELQKAQELKELAIKNKNPEALEKASNSILSYTKGLSELESNPESQLFDAYLSEYIGSLSEGLQYQEIKSDDTWLRNQSENNKFLLEDLRSKNDKELADINNTAAYNREILKSNTKTDLAKLKNGLKINNNESLIDGIVRSTSPEHAHSASVTLDNRKDVPATVISIANKGIKSPVNDSQNKPQKIAAVVLIENKQYFLTQEDAKDIIDNQGNINYDKINDIDTDKLHEVDKVMRDKLNTSNDKLTTALNTGVVDPEHPWTGDSTNVNNVNNIVNTPNEKVDYPQIDYNNLATKAVNNLNVHENVKSQILQDPSLIINIQKWNEDRYNKTGHYLSQREIELLISEHLEN